MNGTRGIGNALWIAFVLIAATASAESAWRTSAKVHASLNSRFLEAPAGEQVKAWVLFVNGKGYGSSAELETALNDLHQSYDSHAILRRMERRTRPGLFDVDDLPLPEPWLEAIRGTGARIVVQSRWAGAVSVRATEEQIRELATLPFVRQLRAVLRGPRRKPAPAAINPDPPAPEGGVLRRGPTADRAAQPRRTSRVGLHRHWVCASVSWIPGFARRTTCSTRRAIHWTW